MQDTDFLTQHALTKECIFTALMILMQEKSFQQISITEISQRAGVSRMAYYRNYQSKEAIITTYLDEIFDEILLEVKANPHFNQHFGLSIFFSSCKENEVLIKNLITHDLIYLLNERLNLYLTLLIKLIYQGEGTAHLLNPYLNEYVCGGLCQVAMLWVKTGMKESNDEMVHLIKKLSRPLDSITF